MSSPDAEVRRFDAVIIGAGVAGLVAALDLLERAPSARIAVVDKGAVGATGSTPLAQGGMAAAVGVGDSAALHGADTLRAGDGLCDPQAVGVVAAEAPERVADLIRRGARFDREPSGALHLAREGAMSVPRSVHAADATGAEIFRTLRDSADGRVTRLQGIVCALAVHPSPSRAVAGAWLLLDDLEPSASSDGQRPGLLLAASPAVLLASGGCGDLYASTTNRDGATADGLALAYAAGATLLDLEFVQFHPTGLRIPGTTAGRSWRMLITEALRGAGAVLVDARGERFMPEVHPDAELAPRHVVTKAILDQAAGAWIDATGLGGARLAREFPTVLQGARRHGFDLATEPVPVEPCQHYMIGGVATDLFGRTSLPGLWAAGEVACTGIHGANRMAGNSLAQACVFAHRAARSMAAEPGRGTPGPGRGTPGPGRGTPGPGRGTPGSGRGTETVESLEPPSFGSSDASGIDRLLTELRAVMSACAGPIRTAEGLEHAEKTLEAIAAAVGPHPAATRAGIEIASLVTVGRLLVRSARLREESRGAHWRDDFPGPAPAWEGVRLRVQRPF